MRGSISHQMALIRPSIDVLVGRHLKIKTGDFGRTHADGTAYNFRGSLADCPRGDHRVFLDVRDLDAWIEQNKESGTV
jgi:hypothetical protein